MLKLYIKQIAEKNKTHSSNMKLKISFSTVSNYPSTEHNLKITVLP